MFNCKKNKTLLQTLATVTCLASVLVFTEKANAQANAASCPPVFDNCAQRECATTGTATPLTRCCNLTAGGMLTGKHYDYGVDQFSATCPTGCQSCTRSTWNMGPLGGNCAGAGGFGGGG